MLLRHFAVGWKFSGECMGSIMIIYKLVMVRKYIGKLAMEVDAKVRVE